MWNIIVYTLACLYCVGAVSRQAEWTSDNYPNPQVNPADCGRPADKAAWVCDPNQIITYDEARILDYMLEAIAHEGATKCPCSANQCENNNSGYKISIALMKKIRIDKRREKKENGFVLAAQDFALDLMKKKWHFGSCEESVVILYSQDDNILYVTYGDTAKLKLTDEYLKIITDHAGPHFVKGRDISVGLKNMVIHLRKVFNNHFHSETVYHTYGKGGAGHVTFGISVLLMSLLATIAL